MRLETHGYTHAGEVADVKRKDPRQGDPPEVYMMLRDSGHERVSVRASFTPAEARRLAGRLIDAAGEAGLRPRGEDEGPRLLQDGERVKVTNDYGRARTLRWRETRPGFGFFEEVEP